MKDFSRQFDHVVLEENGLTQHHLKYIDVHLVSLRTSWTHVDVPSRAVTAISTGRPILFCGSEESDNWQMFEDAACFISETDKMNAEIERFVSSNSKEEIISKANQTKNIIVTLKQQILDTHAQIGKYD